MMYAVKTPKGKILENSIADSMINAIFSGGSDDETLEQIIWDSGSFKDEAIRKRVKRAGYKTIPVKVIEIRNR